MKDNKLGIMPISSSFEYVPPIIVSMLVQALYNIVDSVFVSQVSEQALTAVTLAFPAQNLMIGLATGTAVASTPCWAVRWALGTASGPIRWPSTAFFWRWWALYSPPCWPCALRGPSSAPRRILTTLWITALSICASAAVPRWECSARSCSSACCRVPPLHPPCTPRGWAPSSTSCWIPSSSSCSKWAWWVPPWPPLSASSAAAVWPCI